ncbi:MAG: ribose-phosphate diphosphokinase [Candidatus Micrarchaeota archaeon]
MKTEKLVLKSPNCSGLNVTGDTIEMKRFPDGENYVRIPIGCKGKEVVFIHRCYPEPDSSLIQLFLALRQLKGMGAKAITAVIPYLPYARQDKRFLSGETMSSETICRMIREAGCERLITFDCHFLKKEGGFVYGGLRIDNVSFGNQVVESLKTGLDNPIVISPDEGAEYLTEGEAQKGVMKKVRGGYGHGDCVYREISSLKAAFDVRGRNVIIVDDMIAGGSTMVNALKLCKEKGAKSVRCGAVHGLFLNDALKRLMSSGASKVECTNSIPAEASVVDISNTIEKSI